MTGLEKITEQILAEAKIQSENIAKEAENQVAQILEDANKQAAKLAEQTDAKLATDKTSASARAKSSADLKKRQAILKAKQQLITDIMDKAYAKVVDLPDDKYFEMIVKMLDKYVLGKEGEIYFSKKDLDRLPADIEAEIHKAAAAKGGKLSLVKEPKNIDGGFVLVYGGIEENCSFKAIFSAEKEKLADKVNEFLFA